MSLKILTLNCRGLNGLQKRRDVLNYFKKKFSIYFLQDTHFTSNDLDLVQTIWGYEVFISPGRSDARGTAILFNNNFEFKILSEHTDRVGNLKLEILIENKYNVLLLNIYGQTRDDPDFYKIIDGIINNFQGDFVILGGDFNLIQDDKLDLSNYKTINNPKSRDAVLQLKEKFNLSDPWRIQHDTLKQYVHGCVTTQLKKPG